MKKLNILWVLIILCEYNTVCFSCVVEERIGLLKLKPIFKPSFSWVDGDCCSWESVQCDNNTGRVIQLDLKHRYDRDENLVLNASLFVPFEHLQYLDLSWNVFSNLQINQDLGSSLNKLQVLNLGYNTFYNTSIFQSLSALTSLTVLYLSYNEINGPLSDHGRELCKLKNLKELYLSDNKLSGSIPACFSNLTSLKALDLSNNQLSGNVDPSLLVRLTKLEYFSLNRNQWLDGNLMLNSLVGSRREFHFGYLGLSNCNLNTSTTDLVKILHNQPDLIFLDLSHNKLHGEFLNSLFENNSRLELLNLKNNSLTGHIHFTASHLVNLETLDVSNNYIQGELQPNLGEVLPKLTTLNIANNDLRGAIPISLGNMKDLQFLNLSNNKLSGKLPERLDLSCKRLNRIQLSNNRLEGQIPDILFNLIELNLLDLNNNQFSGNIPSTNFQSFQLTIFDISQNNISGKIPPGLCSLTSLNYLDFSQNQLSGPIPSCLTTLPSLTYLRLQHNKFTGLLPKVSPLNTSGLLTLDLSHNNFSGKIPNWFGFFLNLRVLLLKGNRFNGSIPRELCRLHMIGIMDLSHNSLSESIPLCFANTTFGRNTTDKVVKFGNFFPQLSMSPFDEYQFPDLVIQSNVYAQYSLSEEKLSDEDIEFMMKSRYNSYKGDIINFMSGLDLSCNHLKDNIPLDIGTLTDLRALNLSHNQFTGVIPPSLSNMKQIESIDLSYNKLNGDIPSSLTRLTFLGVFNVAYNNLSGRVPEIAQFSTFSETSYEGNPFLCGPPLLEQCKNNTNQATTKGTLVGQNDVFGMDLISFLASFGATYVTCLLGFVIVLCINPYWRQRWFHFIDTCLSFVFPSWYRY